MQHLLMADKKLEDPPLQPSPLLHAVRAVARSLPGRSENRQGWYGPFIHSVSQALGTGNAKMNKTLGNLKDLVST